MEDIRTAMIRRMAEREMRDPVVQVTEFLHIHVSDAAGMDEIKKSVRASANHSTRSIESVLRSLDQVLAMPPEQSKLLHLVAYDANWGLDDPSDESARQVLLELAQLSREVLAEVVAERGRAIHPSK